ncbi:hypothetical protein ACROYT_G000686 [Oculina patagonica]
MAFACESCMPAQDTVYSQIENLHRRLNRTNELLHLSHRSRENELRHRDKLSCKLKSIEDSVLESVHKKGRDRARVKKRQLSKEENFRSFVKWRKQLWVVLDALDDATDYLSSVNTRSARRAIGELQELKDDITASLIETTNWMSSGEAENLVRMNTVGRYRDLRSPKRSLEAIVNEAEHIRRISHNVSAEMKYELQGLKSECVAMAKDLVALNRILEEQKRALIE